MKGHKATLSVVNLAVFIRIIGYHKPNNIFIGTLKEAMFVLALAIVIFSKIM